jgi:hypothetical protein
VYVASHKLHELRQKLSSLEQEFAHWRDLSKPNEPLRKHHTQIHRILGQLDTARQEIGVSVEALAARGGELDGGVALQREILAVHRIWDFFRSKLALRGDKLFGPYLAAIDEFAWACYRRAQSRVSREHVHPDEIKEPPLVFFNGGRNPFTLPRKFAFWAERVPLDEIKESKLLKILESLPVPVVGIPWYQVRHLPDALAVAHEVGHVVMSDFGLTARVKALLEGGLKRVPEGRCGAWRAWLKEVFADLYGVLAVGPAFVQALVDALAVAPSDVAAEHRTSGGWGRHPPAYLRVLLNVEALAALGYAEEGAELKEHWQAAYASHSMVAFEDDFCHVIGALLGGSFPELGDVRLADVISFDREEHRKACADKERLLAAEMPAAADDVRTVYAAARLAFSENPARYREKGAHELVMMKITKYMLTGGVRAARPSSKARDEYDRARGRQLVAFLRGDVLRANEEAPPRV